MPNNASARRSKDKKGKDKKKKDGQGTDTLSLPKEDTAGKDGDTLSLSSTGKDKATKDSISPSLSPAETWEQIFFSALDKMEKDIQESAAGEIDLEKMDWTWAKTNLLVQFYDGTKMAERKDMRRKFRKEHEGSVSGEELNYQVDVAMLMKALQWRRSVPLDAALLQQIDKSSLSLAGPKGAANTAAQTLAEQALLMEFACSLTDRQNMGYTMRW